MASLSLKHVCKKYAGGVSVVDDFDLDIDDGEFIVIVGPSGSGKSTVLRMIAGLEEITSGELYIDGKLMNDAEPADRDIAMMFQNYELYPHMTVRDNLAYGLKLRRVPSDVIAKKVNAAASMLGIEDILDRKPKALSVGLRRRVALGRVIVREPRVFLLDEPLADLDAKFRIQMRTEITKIHHRAMTAFVYATHDPTEAVTMGTRVVVMNDGVIQQVDTANKLYDCPANKFVACFIGSPHMNIFDAELVEEGGELYALIGESNRVLIHDACARRLADKSFIGRNVLLGIRPEDIRCGNGAAELYPESVVTAVVDVTEKLGDETILYLKVDGKDEYTVARVDSRYVYDQGDKIEIYFATDRAHMFDPETERTLLSVSDK